MKNSPADIRLQGLLCYKVNFYVKNFRYSLFKPYEFYKAYRPFKLYEDIQIANILLFASDIGTEDTDFLNPILLLQFLLVLFDDLFYFF